MSKKKYTHDEVIRAWLDGKEVECRSNSNEKWIKLRSLESGESLPNFYISSEYRVVKQPEYEPFDSYEVLAKLVGEKVKVKNSKSIRLITSLHICFNNAYMREGYRLVIGSDACTTETAFRDYEFLDGTPFGKLK